MVSWHESREEEEVVDLRLARADIGPAGTPGVGWAVYRALAETVDWDSGDLARHDITRGNESQQDVLALGQLVSWSKHGGLMSALETLGPEVAMIAARAARRVGNSEASECITRALEETVLRRPRRTRVLEEQWTQIEVNFDQYVEEHATDFFRNAAP